MATIMIDLKELYADTAKLAKLQDYVEKSKRLAGEGNEIVLTGQGPIWLYLKVAHALHGKSRRLIYRSPGLVDDHGKQVDVVIFDHDPF